MDLIIRIVHDFLHISNSLKQAYIGLENEARTLKGLSDKIDILHTDFEKVKKALEIYEKGEE